MIGKAGRADTPTDPAPLEMVETFVNFRPKELWPKRAMHFDDAARQTRAVLAKLEQQGYVQPAKGDDRDDLINDAAMSALNRFDEAMRSLAVERCQGFEQDLGPALTRFAVAETVRRIPRERRPAMAEWHGREGGDRCAGERPGPDLRQVAGEEPGPGGRYQAQQRRGPGAGGSPRPEDGAGPGPRRQGEPGAGGRDGRGRGGGPGPEDVRRRGAESGSGEAGRAVGGVRGSEVELGAVRPRRGGVHLVGAGGVGQERPRPRPFGRRAARATTMPTSSTSPMAGDLLRKSPATRGASRPPWPRSWRCGRSWRSRSRRACSCGGGRAGRRATCTRRWIRCSRCPAGPTSGRSRSTTASTCWPRASRARSASRCSAPIQRPSPAWPRRSNRRSRGTRTAPACPAPWTWRPIASWARATWRSRSTGRRRPATASASATFRIRLRWHWAAG